MMFMMPIPPTISEMPAMLPRSNVMMVVNCTPSCRNICQIAHRKIVGLTFHYPVALSQ
jgi:hypothetical protein